MKIKSTFNFFFKNIFFDSPSLLDAFTFSTFYFCNTGTKKIGFKRIIFYSKCINLTNPLDAIFANFKSNTRNEIHKAEKMDMKFSIENDLIRFVNFYNSFAETKYRRRVNFKYLSQLGDNLIITKSYFDDVDPLSMHAYLLNRKNKMCILYMSASVFRNLEKEKQKIIGHANRFLHYKDIDYFKSNLFQIYDLGGYAMDVTEGSEQYSINIFKDQFGGQLIEYANYTASILIIALKTKTILKKIIKLTKKDNILHPFL